MDFSALTRSIRNEAPDNFRDSAAGFVGNASPSTLLDNTTGKIAKAARDLAATVVALVRSAGGRDLRQPQRCSSARRQGEANAWQTFDSGILVVRARLTRDAVDSQVFQEQLLLALRHENSTDDEEQGPGVGERGKSTTAAVPLALYWRLHESGLLPFSRLLEAREAFSPPVTLGQRRGGGAQRRFCNDAGEGYMGVIIHGIRALAMQSAREAGDAGSPPGDAASLVSDIAKHLFDLAYRKLPNGSRGLATGRDTTEALSSSAARIVLDQLCCGPEVYGTHNNGQGIEARLRGCFSVLAVIAPVVTLVVSLEPNSISDSQGYMAVPGNIATRTKVREGDVPGDEASAAFLNRQLRLLMENSSGQSAHAQGEDAGVIETETSAADASISGLLADILRHFSPSEYIEMLRSICHRAVARAADTAGKHPQKPLLRWETLGPVVRAAATAHPQEVPAAVALIGTELAEAAVNFIPAGDGDVSRMTGCNQQQGVLVLSAALQLVAQADRGTQRRTGEGGLYAQWVRSCFGPQKRDGCATREIGQAEGRPASLGHEQEIWTPEPHADGSRLSGSEALREAMEKQRATEILMEALCMSVPYDPAFVLEVHKDVLKMRLRSKFSVQVRDFVDLVVTRLSDLKSQEKTKRYKGADTGYDRAMGVEGPTDRETSHLGGDCSDPAVREIGFFLRQFKQTGEVPLALKTAILWHPKSWASFRKVLLAPPAQRIAIPDERGKMLPAGNDLVKETIGRGENGLRVEVSLKYRRLLVQKLAKESLLSAKDHDVFRKSYVEFLQGQRDHGDNQSESPNRAEAVTAVSRQFLLLESNLGQRQQDNQVERGALGTIEERLALLLQEYLPRALGVELCMEGETKSSPHGRDWFARAAHLLNQTLDEWKQRCFAGSNPPGARRASSQDLAEAILNSVHCCVAAVGASLVLPRQPRQDFPGSSNPDLAERKPDWGRSSGTEDGFLDMSSSMDALPELLGLPAAQAFRQIGEMVTIAAGVEPLGEAICQRCFSLLVNPNSLDPKQVMSLCHILAALTPAFHRQVRDFLANLVGNIMLPARVDCAASPEVAGLASTAQVGALYLQSTLLLHEHIWESAAESVDGASLDHNSRWRVQDERQTLELPSGDGGSSETKSCPEKEMVGFAPVILLEFCWWVERRLSIVEESTRLEGRIGPHLTVEIVGLLRLLKSVLKHALIKRALNRVFDAHGSTMPPLEHLISFEMAVSSENDFGGASVKLALLESVTLGRLVVDPTDDTEGLQNGTDEEVLVRKQGKNGASSVLEIWNECAACLFGDLSLRDAAFRRVCRGSTPNEFDHEGGVGIEQVVHMWGSYSHSSWRSAGTSLTSDSEGVQGLLDSILQVMGKLCNLEATAGSMCEKWCPPAGLGESGDALDIVKCSSRRNASLLLTQALALLTRLRTDVAGPSLVLVGEIAIPAIGATEGREKAMASLRLMWKEWFCKVRPLEYGAIVSLMRLALMWCGGPRNTKRGVGEHEDCPVVRMLEDLPLLAAEIVRVWPRLRCTLQPVIGSHSLTGPYARGGWAFHLDNLHRFGEKVVRDLAGGGWASSTSDLSARKTVISSFARPTTNKTGRVPLGPVNISTQDQRKRGEAHAQERGQVGDPCARAKVRAAEPCHEQFRDTSTALPYTSAQLIVGVILATSTFLVKSRPKRCHEVPVLSVDAKRARTLTSTPSGLTRTMRGEGTFLEKTGVCEGGNGRATSQPLLIAFQPPTSAWVAQVLEPLYGPGPEAPTISSLRVLVETLVRELGICRIPSGISKGYAGGFYADVCESFEVSLLVATLGHAPALVARMAEPPCLTASSSSTGVVERLGRSLAVLDSLKLLLNEVPQLFNGKPGAWVTVVLSHYTAALLSMSKDAHAIHALPKGRPWSDVVTFVHAHIINIAPQELRQLPAALRLAAKEVDPLLKQYL